MLQEMDPDELVGWQAYAIYTAARQGSGANADSGPEPGTLAAKDAERRERVRRMQEGTE